MRPSHSPAAFAKKQHISFSGRDALLFNILSFQSTPVFAGAGLLRPSIVPAYPPSVSVAELCQLAGDVSFKACFEMKIIVFHNQLFLINFYVAPLSSECSNVSIISSFHPSGAMQRPAHCSLYIHIVSHTILSAPCFLSFSSSGRE